MLILGGEGQHALRKVLLKPADLRSRLVKLLCTDFSQRTLSAFWGRPTA